MLKIGTVLRFVYEGVERMCDIEATKVGYSAILGKITTHVTGWDATADRGVGGYRTFKVGKMGGIEVVSPFAGLTAEVYGN